MHAGHYVPKPEDIRRLIAIQNAHTQRLMEIVGAATAVKLGLRDLSALHAANVWSNKYPDSTQLLGAALAHKCEGLDSLRREKFQGVRMYDLAEYYYKVPPAPFFGCVCFEGSPSAARSAVRAPCVATARPQIGRPDSSLSTRHAA